jgi:integrase
MGYVETLPSGRFRGVPWNAAAGKRGKSATFDRWAQADAHWRRIEAEMDGDYCAAGIEVVRQGRRVPFGTYVVDFAKTVGGELASRNRAKTHARQLKAQWPTEMVDEITRPMVRAYMAELRDAGYSPPTLQGRLGLLRKTMAAAVEDRVRDDDPCVGIKAPPSAQRHHRILTPEELERVLEHLPPWLRAAALLSHEAGLRIGEVAGLRWFRLDLLHASVEVGDVILEDGSLREYPKGKKILTVPLTARVVDALNEHREQYPAGKTDPVFHRPNKTQRLTPKAIRYLWNKAVAAADLEDPMPRWHDLRHGCATALARAGAPAYVIQEVLRHADLSTSQRYIDRTGIASQAHTFLGRAFGAAAAADAAEDDTVGTDNEVA